MARPDGSIIWDPSEADIKYIETLAGYGLAVEKIAGVFGVSKATFNRRRESHTDVDDALLRGRSKAESMVTQTAYNMAVSGDKPVMTIFWLKTRANWKQTETVNSDVNINLNYKVDMLPDDIDQETKEDSIESNDD